MQLNVLFQELLFQQQVYNKGITASFEQWGASGVASYLLPQSSLCYSTRNMESKIGNQLC
jgi:hypothetical protein